MTLLTPNPRMGMSAGDRFFSIGQHSNPLTGHVVLKSQVANSTEIVSPLNHSHGRLNILLQLPTAEEKIQRDS